MLKVYCDYKRINFWICLYLNTQGRTQVARLIVRGCCCDGDSQNWPNSSLSVLGEIHLMYFTT